ncbi:MAG: tetratricopeptide repeat protein [Planctomycetales bacterium]|nr:tetratricopeptide repeat protein [Planctomycetales bacterium]
MPKRKRPKRPAAPPGGRASDLLQAGIELQQSGKLSRAERIYKKILAADATDALAHHLLGRLYWQTQRQQAAVDSLQRALSLRGDYPEALLDLGNMLAELSQLEQAEDCLRRLVRLSPQNAMAHNNLGVVLKDQGRHAEAIRVYRQAIALEPGNSDTLCNLAHVHSLQGELETAAEMYRAVLAGDPTNVDALGCLASILRRLDHDAEARQVLAAWRKVDPDNPIPEHLLSVYEPTSIPERASDQYVRQVFDRFAASFETDLAQLEYRGPQLIEQGLKREFSAAQPLDCVLDAGCGTGLCGPVLRDYAQRLVGIDLSPKMLEVAAERQLYDELVESELCDYLARHEDNFDLIACADTFGYFGALSPLFAAAKRALRPAGRLLVTVELQDAEEQPGYQLRSSGRYAHHRDYVARCCEMQQLKIHDQTEDTMRQEAGRAVRVLVLTASAAA